MDTNIILTFTGADRIGIVEEVTSLLLNRGSNVEVSHMAHLASEFAILMLVSLPSEQLAGLETDLQSLIAQGYKVTTCSPKATAKASQNTNTGAGQLNFGKGQSQSGNYYNNQGVTIK